ncbi:MAG: hypothetical protein QOF62_2616 [Pyrinomonadaceae bacterium]|jgi:hypothetical protein|nr:hypothetical protein [Pyrinomonadaceae bacterium]
MRPKCLTENIISQCEPLLVGAVQQATEINGE